MRGSFHRFTTAGSRPASRRLGAAVAAMLWLIAAPALAARPKLTDVRIGVHKDFTRVVLETDAAVHARVHQSAGEIRVHLDASSKPRAVTAKSHLLTWVKVEPSGSGSEVAIQLRGPATLKRMVLHKPDRLVLDVYPARHAAATPAPSKPAPTASAQPPAPAPEAAAPTAPAQPSAPPPAPAPSEAQAPATQPSPGPSPGVGAPGAAEGGPSASPGAMGQEAAGEAGAPASPPAEAPPAAVPRPIPPPHPRAGGGRGLLDFLPPPFDQPITLTLIAVLLLALFVLLRIRRHRVAQAELSPFPPDADLEGEEESAAGEAALFGGDEEQAPPARPQPSGPVTVPPPEAPAPPPLRPAAPPAASAALAGTPGAAGPQGELERRVAHLEGRLEELLDSKERLERQVVAQTEELRVQRAAIARTQRVLRTIARPEDEATEPAPKT